MVGRQRILPVRRDYNRWVADDTLEDFALRFTAKGARRWSSSRSWRWPPSGDDAVSRGETAP